MVIPLKLSRQDFCSHRILRETTAVGWIGPDAARLWGFTDREGALRGAAIAAAIRTGWSAGRAQHQPVPVTATTDARQATATATQVRVIEPGTLRDGQPLDTFAIEITVPRGAWLAMKLQLVQQVYAALLAEEVLEDPLALAATS